MAKERGITEFEMVFPETAHPAFDKACMYLGVKPILVPYDHKSGKVFINKLKAAVNKNTVGIAVSCPNYPNGNFDDIDEIGAFCLKKNLPMHVDCCIGGFTAPFAEKFGRRMPIFDFRNPAVTSISVDHHKYGMAPKGFAILLFKDKKVRSHSYFAKTNWPGGVYACPGMLGSRSGAPSAGGWVSMVYHGYDGYAQKAKAIFETQDAFVKKLKDLKQLRIIGEPVLGLTSVTAAEGTNTDIFGL
mmetsp:Transcript_41789/g.37214  ORF Transcript_41789/g.37214 Transcript_41789/m.37214 type:complete len:244 (+) Transcript_41789:708-1439(+)